MQQFSVIKSKLILKKKKRKKERKKEKKEKEEKKKKEKKCVLPSFFLFLPFQSHILGLAVI